MTNLSRPWSKDPVISVYDYLKCLALFLMVIDHLGAFFFVYDPEWRAVGRLSAPIWLFLIGYARSRNITPALLGGAIVLSAASYYTNHGFVIQNILWPIILIRLTLNPVMRWVDGNETRLLVITGVLFVLTPLTSPYVDYGSIGYILAIWGYLARNGFNDRPLYPVAYGIAALLLYFYVQVDSFKFNIAYSVLIAGGLAGVYYLLMHYFRQGQTGWSPKNRPLRQLISLAGRHTLVFYVAHLLIIYAITIALCQCYGPCQCVPLGLEPLRHLH